jgi:threonine/homoserine/homoserine lactone efflux protein
MTDGPVRTQDALTNLLLPFWQVVISVCVAVAVVVAAVRLARRGRSRVNAALLLTGGTVVGVCAVGLLLHRLLPG